MFNFDAHNLYYALLTIALEVPVFGLLGYRKTGLLLYFALVNTVSNLLLNEALPVFEESAAYWVQLALGELLVIGLEYVLMRYILLKDSLKLFFSLVVTNGFSLMAGLILFYINK